MNVHYCPKLDDNLVSVSSLTKDGYSVTFRNDVCVVEGKNNNVVLKTNEVGLYAYSVVHFQNSNHNVYQLHCKHGHIGLKKLRCLYPTIPSNARLPNCTICILAKHQKKKFGSRTRPKMNPLEYLHGDLGGPISPTSKRNNQYYFELIDDHSGYIFIFLLKHKLIYDELNNFIVYIKTH